ncbi:MAG: ABC transporter permease [Fusicatenibacter sp.]
MLMTIIRKMWNKKMMMASLLLGNLLFISIAAANPMFLQASLRRALNTSIEALAEQQGCWPMTYSVTPASSYKPQFLRRTTNELLASADDFDLPLHTLVTIYSLKPEETVSNLDRQDRVSALQVSTITDIGNHIEILSGTGMSKEPDEDSVIDAVVSRRTFRKCGLILGEILTFENTELSPGVPLRIRIAGIFQNNLETDPYWINAPDSYTQSLFIDDSLYSSLYLSDQSNCKSKAAWYALYDYSDISLNSIPSVLTQIARYDELFMSEYGTSHFCSFAGIYEDYLVTKRNTEITFRVLQVPFLLLLVSFILMVSRQLIHMEMAEIAVYKSRGLSRKQIITMYLLQSLILALVAALFAVPLSILLVKLLGSASGFLTFSGTHTFQPRFSFDSLLYAAVAVLFSVFTMLLPVISQSKTTIVRHRADKYRKGTAPLWQKYFLDLVILCVALYGLFNYSAQKDALLSRILSGKPLDPLPFLCSSLFLLGAGLLSLRLGTCLIRFIFWLFKKKWNPALYASFSYIIKTRRQQNYFVIFLFLTVALGIFNSSAARTINNNDEQNTRYLNGTDLIVRERWQSNRDSEDVQLNGGKIIYQEPDFSRYSGFDDVIHTAKVYRSDSMNVTISSSTLKNVELMGIWTKDFGETARFDTSLLPEHWYNYLNLLAKDPNGLLLSTDFQTDFGVRKNDSIVVKNVDGSYLRGTVLDFVDYWPGYAPSCCISQSDGTIKGENNYLIIAGLSAVQDSFGLLPYEVWIKTNGTNEGVYQGITDLGIPVESVSDTSKLLQNRKNDALINSTNGVLTLGFLIIIILCAAGFLIYWTLSIKERELQFGIFRAMGMAMSEIAEMLINEQIFISLLPILFGAFFGWLAAKLYMPLIQMVYSSADYVIPLKVISSAADNLRLSAVILIVLGVCMTILIKMIQKLKIAQALKLGED